MEEIYIICVILGLSFAIIFGNKIYKKYNK